MADDCALAGYFSKLLGILLSRSAEQILKYLKVSSLCSQWLSQERSMVIMLKNHLKPATCPALCILSDTSACTAYPYTELYASAWFPGRVKR